MHSSDACPSDGTVGRRDGWRRYRTALHRGSGARRRDANTAPVRGLVAIVLLLAAWELFGSKDSFSYPPPSTWIGQLRSINEQGAVVSAILMTLATTGIGLLLAIVIGVVGGIIVGTSRTIDMTFSPVADFFRSLPPPAVISVILLTFGLGYRSALLVVTIGATWPILLNTASGVREISPVRIEMSRVIGLSRSAHLAKVLIPSVLPSALTGLRVSVAIAYLVTIFIEILGVTGGGLGTLLLSRQTRFDSPGTWGLVLVIGVTGYLLSMAVAHLDRVLLRGRPSGVKR